MTLKKIVLFSIGIIFLALGFVGIFLPILPTTPFVLVAAACFGSSSPKFYSWLIKNKYLGCFIENYKSKTGIPVFVKVRAIIFLWCSLTISALIFQHLHVWIILPIVGICVTAHLLMLKTKKETL